jgi:hypothetical protein
MYTESVGCTEFLKRRKLHMRNSLHHKELAIFSKASLKTPNGFFRDVPLLVFCMGLLISCSRAEPKITYGFISLTYYQDQGKIRERFSFFIIPEDEDGLENLEDLFLYHDQEQLRWRIKSDDWMTHNENGKTWIGSRSLALEDGESFPRGQYRAVLINKGGERTQRNFTFDVPEESRYPFPSVEINEGIYVINSKYPDHHFVCYDAEGNYIATVKIYGLIGDINNLGIPPEARIAALWAEDPMYFTSAFTEVVNLH